MNLTDLCTRAHNTAKKSGFLEKPQTWEEVTNLIHSELSEATEEYRGHRGLNEVYYEFKVKKEGEKDILNVLTLEQYKALTPEAQKGGKPCGIPSELADVVIRIAQYCGTTGWDLQGTYNDLEGVSGIIATPKSFLRLIAVCHTDIAGAYLAGETDGEGSALHCLPEGVPDEPVTYFAICLMTLFAFAKANEIDLEKAIEEKATFNATRPYRHGNKKI